MRQSVTAGKAVFCVHCWRVVTFHAGIEPLRAVLGAGANTLVTPPNLADWEPGYQKPTWYDKKMSVEDVVDAASQTTEVK